MPADLKLSVDTRSSGKAGRREVQETEVIGVIYGSTDEPVPVRADYNALAKMYRRAGTNQIVDVMVSGDKNHEVLFKDVQFDPRTNRIHHFDLYAVKQGQKLQTEVPVRLVGEAPAVESGHVIAAITETVLVETTPRKLPEYFEVDVSALNEVGDSIAVEAIKTGDKDVVVLSDPELIIVKVDAVKIQEEEPAGDAADEGADAASDQAEEVSGDGADDTASNEATEQEAEA